MTYNASGASVYKITPEAVWLSFSVTTNLKKNQLSSKENRITAWKFCHLLHKVLREGHPLCCQHSMRHRGMLAELGKLWVHIYIN